MTEHWKTKAKRLALEAEARGEMLEEQAESIENDETFDSSGIVQAIKSLPSEMNIDMPERLIHVGEVSGRSYRVYNSRADLVAGVETEEEAEKELKRFPGGFIKLI
jgi:hypothetical protein